MKPEFQQDYMAVLVAGRKVMLQPDLFKKEVVPYLNAIKGPQDVPRYIGHGIVKLISIVIAESKRPKDLSDKIYPASIPAAIVLMCDAMEFLSKRMPITPQLVADTTSAVTRGLYKLYGITPEMVRQAMAQQPGQTAPGAPPQPGAPAPQPGAPAPPGV